MTVALSETTIHNFPYAFINKKGEPILVKTLDPKRHRGLTDMYLAFRPRNCFSGLPPIDDGACIRWVNGMIATGVNLVALSFEEGVVGHAALFGLDGGRCEFLCVVAPAHQGIGIGTALTRCAVQLAHELDFETICLHVEAKNHVARHVYEKSGFQYESRGLRDELDMTLDLRGYRSATSLAVRDIMQTRVVTVGPEMSCERALRLFLDDRVATLPVVDESNHVMGILSETDLMVEANVRRMVREVLTREVVTVHQDSTLAEVISLFQSRRLRCIPVVNRRRELVGIVGRKEILAHYGKRL